MSNERSRILIIDDDEGFCRLVNKHLDRPNYEIRSANSATSGFEALEDEPFDVVILDHYLPEHDGLALLLKLQSKGDSPPVIYLTANADSRVAVAALKAGAADYVIKDVQGDFLLLLESAVNNAICAAAIRRDKERAEAEVREARDEFKALAEERALLLREVSHRVSNSLQLIAALLHFQGDLSEDGSVKAALKEANGRVLAVARVHRSLYTSFDVRWVSLADYLTSLIDDLKDVSANGIDQRAKITFSSDSVQAAPDTAVAVGIITTELVLNSLKHAYPNGIGPVRVALTAKQEEIELSVEDDGFAEVADGVIGGKSRRGLGQRIISGMADKLDGHVTYHQSARGTRATLTFPVRENILLGAPNRSGEVAPL